MGIWDAFLCASYIEIYFETGSEIFAELYYSEARGRVPTLGVEVSERGALDTVFMYACVCVKWNYVPSISHATLRT